MVQQKHKIFASQIWSMEALGVCWNWCAHFGFSNEDIFEEVSQMRAIAHTIFDIQFTKKKLIPHLQMYIIPFQSMYIHLLSANAL